jgi:hypothetical protein
LRFVSAPRRCKARRVVNGNKLHDFGSFHKAIAAVDKGGTLKARVIGGVAAYWTFEPH